jgi:hypothetical protein
MINGLVVRRRANCEGRIVEKISDQAIYMFGEIVGFTNG